jgi:hypothetical protein
MEYNDLNIIQPVESLDNITAAAASKSRDERKRRQQNLPEKQNNKKMHGELLEIPDKPDKQGIDYSA